VAKKGEADVEKELKKKRGVKSHLHCRKKGYGLKETGQICKENWKKIGS
jgi:hypothetical protein